MLSLPGAVLGFELTVGWCVINRFNLSWRYDAATESTEVGAPHAAVSVASVAACRRKHVFLFTYPDFLSPRPLPTETCFFVYVPRFSFTPACVKEYSDRLKETIA